MRTEGEVERLRREVSKHVGDVSSPQRSDTLISDGTLSAVDHPSVWGGQTTLLDLYEM